MGEGVDLLIEAHLKDVQLADDHMGTRPISYKGVVIAVDSGELGAFIQEFKQAIAAHRHWERESVNDQIPA